jgi:hypothetical protein
MARLGMKGRASGIRLEIVPTDLIRASKTIMRSRDVVLNVAQAAFVKVTQQIKDESREIVPYKTGKLQRSAYKFVNRRAWYVDAEVGYNRDGSVPYAEVRHQVAALKYTTPGTGFKYLIRAFDKYADDIADIIEKSVRKRFTTKSGTWQMVRDE